MQVWPDGAKYEGQWENGKANGHGIVIPIKGSSSTSTGTSTKGSGRTIKHQAREFTSIIMEPGTKDSGWTIINTEKELRPGWMVAGTRAATSRGRRTEEASTRGKTVPTTRDSGKTTRSMVLAFMSGRMDDSTKVNG